MASARKALDEIGDMNYQSRSLSDVINDIKTKTKVPVVLDNMVFQLGLDPTQPVVTVNLKQVKLATVSSPRWPPTTSSSG